MSLNYCISLQAFDDEHQFSTTLDEVDESENPDVLPLNSEYNVGFSNRDKMK